MEFLGKDCLSIVYQYLPFDKLCGGYQLIGRSIPNDVYTIYTQLIKDRLSNEYGFDGQFLEILDLQKAVISGSFVLQTLIDERWDSDLDIYLLDDNTQVLSEYMAKISDDPNHDAKRVASERYPSLASKGIQCTVTYLVRQKKVQLIYLHRGEIAHQLSSRALGIKDPVSGLQIPDIISRLLIKEWIKKIFDFEFCTSTFDGCSLEVPYINSIITRSSNHRLYRKGDDLEILGDGYGADLHHRSLKYIDRGFTITNYSRPSIIKIPVFEYGCDPNKYFDTCPIKDDHLIKELMKREDIKFQWIGDGYLTPDVPPHLPTTIDST